MIHTDPAIQAVIDSYVSGERTHDEAVTELLRINPTAFRNNTVHASGLLLKHKPYHGLTSAPMP